MAVFTVLGIISVFIRLILCQSSVTHDCGTLEIVQPAVLGREVILKFTPTDQTRARDGIWYYAYYSHSTPSEINTKTTSKYVTQKNGSIFSLTIKQLNYNDEGYYSINMYEHRRWICTSGRVELELQELGHCGVLYLQSPLPVEKGSSVKLRYIPAKSQNHQWIFKRVGSTSYNPVTTNGTTIEEHTLPLNDERVLTIRNIQPSQAGTYSIQCGSTDSDSSNTNIVTIDVVVLPKDVHFISPNKTFPKCNECMYQQYNTWFDVNCSFIEGTENATVHITVASVELATHKKSKGVYYGIIAARDSYHMKEVKCHVTTPSLQQPLTVTSTLYVLREPANPVLTMSTIKQGQPVGITCVCDESRPPPRMFFLIGKETVNANQTDVEYYLRPSKKYNSTAVLEIVEKRWNTKQLKCCLEHETLTYSKCSDRGIIHYEFPPTAVTASHSDFPQEPKSSYTVEVVCTVLDANPACGVSLGDIEEDNLRNVSTEYQPSEHGGETTITSFILNVKQEDQGKLVTCVANCSEFKSKLRDSFTLTLPVVRTQESDPGSSAALIWIIVGISVGVVIVGIVVVSIICYRRRDSIYEVPSRTEPVQTYTELNAAEVLVSSDPGPHIYDEAEMSRVTQQVSSDPGPHIYDEAEMSRVTQQESTDAGCIIYDDAHEDGPIQAPVDDNYVQM